MQHMKKYMKRNQNAKMHAFSGTEECNMNPALVCIF